MTMAALVDTARYNNLPSLDEAHANFQASHVNDVVNGPLRELFLKHGVHRDLCLYLQHRHHAVGADQAVIKIDGNAHVFDEQNVQDVYSFGNKVVPATWMTTAKGVMPMEFAVVPKNEHSPTMTPEFMAEFMAVLTANNCATLFGVDSIAKAAWSEMTIGDASVVVPANKSVAFDADKYIPVALSFDEKKPGFKVHGRCGTDHRHTSKVV